MSEKGATDKPSFDVDALLEARRAMDKPRFDVDAWLAARRAEEAERKKDQVRPKNCYCETPYCAGKGGDDPCPTYECIKGNQNKK